MSRISAKIKGNSQDKIEIMLKKLDILKYTIRENVLTLDCHSDNQDEIIQYLYSQGFSIMNVNKIVTTLHDIYFKVTREGS